MQAEPVKAGTEERKDEKGERMWETNDERGRGDERREKIDGRRKMGGTK